MRSPHDATPLRGQYELSFIRPSYILPSLQFRQWGRTLFHVTKTAYSQLQVQAASCPTSHQSPNCMSWKSCMWQAHWSMVRPRWLSCSPCGFWISTQLRPGAKCHLAIMLGTDSILWSVDLTSPAGPTGLKALVTNSTGHRSQLPMLGSLRGLEELPCCTLIHGDPPRPIVMSAKALIFT